MNRLLFILIACLLGFPALLAKAEEPALITAQDYCHFLKCAALSDPHCFYEERMATDQTCIVREGTPGNYDYSVLPGKENQLVSYLNWHDAACYVNWNQQGEDHLSDDLTLSSSGFQVDDAAQNSDQELKSNIVHFSLINDKTLDDVRLPSQKPPSWISYMMIPFLFLAEEGNPEDRVLPHDEEDSHVNKKARKNVTEPLAPSNANKSPLLSQALMTFIQHDNRADGVCKKKEEYQKELKILSPDSNRALLLNHLIPILEKAISYQNALIGHFLKNVEPHNSEKEALKAFRIAEYVMRSNGLPNKVELIAKQIEEDYEHLTGYQNKLSEVEAQIDLQPGQIQLNELFDSCEHLNKAIELQCTLIEQRATYAQLLHPPCQQLDTKAKATIEKNKRNLIEATALVQKKYFLGQTYYLQVQVNTAKDLGQLQKVVYLLNAINDLLQAAEEAQKTPKFRKQEVINWFQHSADLRQKAATAWDLGLLQKALYLNNAGNALFCVAQETQKTPELRNPEVINWFQRAINLYQEAANEWDTCQPNKALYLNKAGNALFHAAQEAQKPEPNLEVIAKLVKEAEEFEEKANSSSSCIIS